MEKLISEFSFGLFFWQLLIFIFLVLLLKKFAWKPILDTVNERESSIKDAMREADKARNEMAAIQESNQKVLKEARAEREALLKDASATGAEMIAQSKMTLRPRQIKSFPKHKKPFEMKNVLRLMN